MALAPLFQCAQNTAYVPLLDTVELCSVVEILFYDAVMSCLFLVIQHCVRSVCEVLSLENYLF